MTNARLTSVLAALACALLGGAADAQVIGATALESPDLPTVNAVFGRALAVDGSRLVVGVSRLDVQGESGLVADSGGAFVYERTSSGAWSRVGEALPTAPLANLELGTSVAVLGDVIALGAPLDSTVGVFRGSVSIFERSGVGTWPQTQTLYPPTSGTKDFFGNSVILGGDRLLIVAPITGHIFVYERNGEGLWSPESVVTPTLALNSWTIAYTEDRIAVGGASSGLVQLYERAGPDWNLVATLSPQPPMSNSSFGSSIAFSADGSELYVGAPKLGATGAVVVFELQPNLAWAQSDVITANVPEGGLGFQITVAGERIVASVLPKQGYPVLIRRSIIFERAAGTWSPVMEAHHTEFSSTTIRAATADQLILGSSAIGTDGAFGTFELGSLRASGRFVDTSTGGAQLMYLRAGPAVANDWFVLLGCLTADAPGIPLGDGSLTLPLAFDAYTSLIVESRSPLQYWLGPLDANGNANSSFVVPPFAYAALSGLVLHHAFFTLDLTTFAVEHVSNVVPVELVP